MSAASFYTPACKPPTKTSGRSPTSRQCLQQATSLRSTIDKADALNNDAAASVSTWLRDALQNSQHARIGGYRGGYAIPGPSHVSGTPAQLASEWLDAGLMMPELIVSGSAVYRSPETAVGAESASKVAVFVLVRLEDVPADLARNSDGLEPDDLVTIPLEAAGCDDSMDGADVVFAADDGQESSSCDYYPPDYDPDRPWRSDASSCVEMRLPASDNNTAATQLQAGSGSQCSSNFSPPSPARRRKSPQRSRSTRFSTEEQDAALAARHESLQQQHAGLAVGGTAIVTISRGSRSAATVTSPASSLGKLIVGRTSPMKQRPGAGVPLARAPASTASVAQGQVTSRPVVTLRGLSGLQLRPQAASTFASGAKKR